MLVSLGLFTCYVGVLYPVDWSSSFVVAGTERTYALPWFQRYKITNSIEIETRNAEKIDIRSPFFMFLVKYQ